LNLQGKTILVTGASGGIGRILAGKLAARKSHVLLVGRDEGALSETESGIRIQGGSAQMLVADLLKPEDRQKLVDVCGQLPQGLFGLVNNAGVNHFAWLSDQSDSMLQSQLELNLLVPILLTRDLLPALQNESGSRVLNIGSTFGNIGYPGYTAYCASKFGLRGFTEALRRELADTDIHILYLAPRATDTRLNPAPVIALNKALGNAMDPPEQVAVAAEKMFIEGGPHQLFLGWPEKLFARVNQILPAMVDSALLKQLPIIRKYAKPIGQT
jgi:short-subunit dehydrogenase